ncbi:phosducin-like protein 3 [Alosa sapidissima]|uniref:phosducin-like protein 3 n=1 Tax=Alosa sapidissima TaxID=34773 RepID=UPI001C09979D|nr:phosducin-like protein 3 [Alosa sapidissima]
MQEEEGEHCSLISKGPTHGNEYLDPVTDKLDGTNYVVEDYIRPDVEEELGYDEEEEAEEEEEEDGIYDDNYDDDIVSKFSHCQVWQPKRKKRETFGQLREITGEDYVKEVTHAGRGVKVLLFLYRPGIPLCFLMNHHFLRLAPKFPDTKFLRILDSSCIPNYPERHLPTVFIYENGCLRNSMIGEQECGGRNVLEEELKWLLYFVGAID